MKKGARKLVAPAPIVKQREREMAAAIRGVRGSVRGPAAQQRIRSVFQ